VVDAVSFQHLTQRVARLRWFFHERCDLSVGDRVLLAYPPSRDLVDAFLGCLFSGIVPVVVPVPDIPRDRVGVSAFAAAAKRTEASAILTNQAYLRAKKRAAFKSLLRLSGAGWPSLPWHCTDAGDAAGDEPAEHWPEPGDVAFYQGERTANGTGSVGIALGKLSHRNLMRQLRRQASRSRSDKSKPAEVRVVDLVKMRSLHKLLASMYGASIPQVDKLTPSALAARQGSAARPSRARRPSWDLGTMEVAASGSGPVLTGMPTPAGPGKEGTTPPDGVPRVVQPKPTTSRYSQPVFSAGRRRVTGDLREWKKRLNLDD
jgi:acyl-CoA synthetase (AMP-forming)/AMP-acid ligase II